MTEEVYLIPVPKSYLSRVYGVLGSPLEPETLTNDTDPTIWRIQDLFVLHSKLSGHGIAILDIIAESSLKGLVRTFEDLIQTLNKRKASILTTHGLRAQLSWLSKHSKSTKSLAVALPNSHADATPISTQIGYVIPVDIATNWQRIQQEQPFILLALRARQDGEINYIYQNVGKASVKLKKDEILLIRTSEDEKEHYLVIFSTKEASPEFRDHFSSGTFKTKDEGNSFGRNVKDSAELTLSKLHRASIKRNFEIIKWCNSLI